MLLVFYSDTLKNGASQGGHDVVEVYLARSLEMRQSSNLTDPASGCLSLRIVGGVVQ